ncbi:mCG147422 [Mus musculus]|nr:mCG147422 [Mus musculus]
MFLKDRESKISGSHLVKVFLLYLNMAERPANTRKTQRKGTGYKLHLLRTNPLTGCL